MKLGKHAFDVVADGFDESGAEEGELGDGDLSLKVGVVGVDAADVERRQAVGVQLRLDVHRAEAIDEELPRQDGGGRRGRTTIAVVAIVVVASVAADIVADRLAEAEVELGDELEYDRAVGYAAVELGLEAADDGLERPLAQRVEESARLLRNDRLDVVYGAYEAGEGERQARRHVQVGLEVAHLQMLCDINAPRDCFCCCCFNELKS